ncbi:MAG: heme-binding protein [Planctomycetota bacterium]|jgi:uncharacterized surface protein with fasciclin (FAS1) repeats
MKTFAPLLCSLLLLPLALPVQASGTAPRPSRDLVDTAVAAGDFETLAAALKAAGLVDALKGQGPFTVFAPTDEAFSRLPAGMVEQLLEPANRARLQAVLTYHVVPGRVLSKDLLGATAATSLEGRALSFGLRVGEANVVNADIECANGVIHVIDRVLMPPASEAAPASGHSVTELLQTAIRRGVPIFNRGDHAGTARIYEAAARTALKMDHEALGPMHRHVLESGLTKHARNDSERAWNLRHAFDRVLADLAFEPFMEAPLPEGFPAPGPVGRVVVKEYPRYRAARAEGRNSFWTLFRHIKKNDVQMTAPVEQTMNDDMREVDMAFLYEEPDQGVAGMDGKVRVLDHEPLTVLSIGMRGGRDAEMVQRAKTWIEERLAAEGLKRAGDWRLLGYNSPMVPASKRFWELQLPVKR